MIQEQISTSSPKCLNGNAGFGVVAQTSGMAPNVARDVGALSGYSHLFSAGDAKNPVAFLHAIRRTGGVNRHILSRVADCGNDYTGRSNRIGHHWIVEEDDIRLLPGGPAAIASQHNLFCTSWKEKSQELPRGKQLPNPQVNAGICRTWQQRLGDAGWGGVVAERVEKGDPVSIIFEPGMDVLPLLAEVFALLSPSVRWRTTFSTYYMKSQEPPNSPKIQIKCIVAGSDEMAFARLTPNTLLIDLRRLPKDQPSGKYVEFARTGVYTKPAISTRTQQIQAEQDLELFLVQEEMDNVAEIYEIVPGSRSVPLATPIRKRIVPKSQASPLPQQSSKWLIFGITVGSVLLLIFIIAVIFVMAKNLKGGVVPENPPPDVSPKVPEDEPQDEDEYEKDKIANAKEKALDAKKLLDDATGIVDTTEETLKEINSTKDFASADINQKIQKSREILATVERNPENAKIGAGGAQNNVAEYLENVDADEVRKIVDDVIAEADKVKGRIDIAVNALNEAQEKHDAAKDLAQKIANAKTQLASLHGVVWKGIKSGIAGTEKSGVLEGTEFLVVIKEHVKIFIDEEHPYIELRPEPGSKEKPIYQTKEENKIVFSHNIGDKKEEIISFFLNDKGLSYEWNKKTIEKNTEDGNKDAYRGQLHRILLSKLRIEIEDNFAEIALWTPIKTTVDKDGSFSLWDYNEVDINEEPLLLLDFEKCVLNEGGYPGLHPIDQKFEKIEIEIEKNDNEKIKSISYSPRATTIGDNKSTIRFGLVRDESGGMKIHLIKDIAPELKKQLEETKAKIDGKYKERNFNTKPDFDESTGFLTEANKFLKDLLAEVRKTKEQNSDDKEADKAETKSNNDGIDKWHTEVKDLVKEHESKQNEIIKEMDKWVKGRNKVEISISDFTITPFTIYLVKPGTSAEDAGKDENRLELLYVPDDPWSDLDDSGNSD